MNSRFYSITIFIFLLLNLFPAGGNLSASPLPEIKSFVVFISIEQDDRLIPNGTGFFVGVKNPSEKETFSIYLLTAKSVLRKSDTTQYLDKIFVRLNKRDGGFEIGRIPIRLKDKNKTVFFHSDPTVDVVAIPFLPDQKKFNFKVLPDEYITTKKDYAKFNLCEGYDVFFTGLFVPHPGSDKNYPVVRFGRIAYVTDEKIEWQGKPKSLYLIETCLHGGSDIGTPVFLDLEGKPILRLIGIMQGTFQNSQVKPGKTMPSAPSNAGISAIIPSYKIHELLFSEELKKKRGF